MPKPEAVTFKQLRALQAVVAHGSISAAAEAIRLTPPAVHTQLRGLERNFNCKVLERSPAGVSRLTPQGEAVLTAARAIGSALESCADHVRALNAGVEGLVTLGVVSTGKYFGPTIVAALRQAYPKIEVLLKVGNRDSTIAHLQASSVDIAIMGRPPRVPDVKASVLGPHPHVLIAPPGHRLVGAGRVSPAALLDETFLVREEGSGTRILTVRYLDKLGQGRAYRLIELDSNETIKQAVVAGLGVALISRHTITDELKNGRLVLLEADGLPLVRQWFLLHRRDAVLSSASRKVHDYILGMQGGFLPR
ncbi:DNA-binding transcriptional LysR family regulator [Rhodovulum imhoffii]|uniref:HTH-type transcriptional regulator CbbR n=1 Tax=Rhodovulum imhoffii TaxID=365340 RepID=A0A2T5BNS8_9RHOB|nr:LysR family transcriptional regulator [Rhodovulum imhoffii]MBK5933847.1 LysR family transcriptional regulator [Rhodovulum imhoffii]PTN00661.1 DNA-binding transcriptional LysR family regulator [Rhodovulum imhoffii]